MLTQHSSVFQIISWNWKHLINCKAQVKKVFWHMILHSYLWHPSWLLMYCGRTVTNSQQRCSIKKLLTNSYKFCNILRKKPVLRSLLNMLGGFQTCSFSKNWLQHRCFLWILGNFKVIEIWKLSRFENLTEMGVLG